MFAVSERKKATEINMGWVGRRRVGEGVKKKKEGRRKSEVKRVS